MKSLWYTIDGGIHLIGFCFLVAQGLVMFCLMETILFTKAFWVLMMLFNVLVISFKMGYTHALVKQIHDEMKKRN